MPAWFIPIAAVAVYAIVAHVLELVRYETTLRQRIQFDRVRSRVVDNQ